MDINVNLDAQAINAAVTQAVLDSALGVELNKIINQEVGKLSRGWDNPIEKAVQVQIGQIVMQVVRDEYRDQITAAVREKVSEAFTEQLISKLWDTFVGQFVL